MGYKLVAIDCDNTLLNSKGHIPPENKKIIQTLKSKGIEFVIATGRNDLLVSDYINELDIKAPVIGCNGASIRNLNESNLLSFNPISKKSLKLIFDYCSNNEIPFKAFTMKKGFANDKVAVEQGLKQILSSYTKELSKNISYEYTTDTKYLIETQEIIKVVIVNNNPDYIKKYQNDIKKIEGIEICRSARNCLDIMASGVSKGNALKKYANMLKIPPEQTVAFGDSENDLSMIEFAGMGVAMENGEDGIKKSANMITCSNDDCGVAKALKKIFEDILK